MDESAIDRSSKPSQRIERLTAEITDGISHTLTRIRALIAVVAILAALIGVATLVTGNWVFDGSGIWWLIGGVICLIPVGAALIGWLLVGATAKAAPRLAGEVQSFLDSSLHVAGQLIDHDSGRPLAMQAKSFSALRAELKDKRDELPALFAGVRAITSVPGLAAVAVLGMCLVGVLGTILLIGGVID